MKNLTLFVSEIESADLNKQEVGSFKTIASAKTASKKIAKELFANNPSYKVLNFYVSNGFDVVETISIKKPKAKVGAFDNIPVSKEAFLRIELLKNGFSFISPADAQEAIAFIESKNMTLKTWMKKYAK